MIDINIGVKFNADGNFVKAWSIDNNGVKKSIPIVAPEIKSN